MACVIQRTCEFFACDYSGLSHESQLSRVGQTTLKPVEWSKIIIPLGNIRILKTKPLSLLNFLVQSSVPFLAVLWGSFWVAAGRAQPVSGSHDKKRNLSAWTCLCPLALVCLIATSPVDSQRRRTGVGKFHPQSVNMQISVDHGSLLQLSSPTPQCSHKHCRNECMLIEKSSSTIRWKYGARDHSLLNCDLDALSSALSFATQCCLHFSF